MAAFSPQQTAIRTSNGALQMNALEVGGDFWKIVSPHPALGRVFGPDEQNVIVLSWDFFRRELGGDSAIIGSPVVVTGNAMTVVGVLPENFRFQFPAWWGSARMDGYTAL